MTNPEPTGAPSTIPLDMDRPNGSRLYDYFLGGTSYLPVDRDAGEEIAREAPHWALGARLTRTFARRAVQTMANAGVEQFLDLGSGITAGAPSTSWRAWSIPRRGPSSSTASRSRTSSGASSSATIRTRGCSNSTFATPTRCSRTR